MNETGLQNAQKCVETFECKKCLFITSRKYDFDRHCMSSKHNKNAFGLLDPGICVEPVKASYKCGKCERKYETSSGLRKHTQKCLDQKDVLVNLLLKENNELMTTMLQRDDEYKRLIIEVCKNTQAITNNNTQNAIINSNSNNTQNNTFSLHFFLNETCKDALNLSEFIQTIKSSLDDLDKIGNMGYVDGLSEFIIKQLHALGVEKRPIHCTDAKRQTLYIKVGGQWTKEESNQIRLQHLVDEVQQIHLRLLPLWRENHPDCLTSTSKYTNFYNQMSQELMGGFCHNVKLHVKDNKIKNRIVKQVVIEKRQYIGQKTI